MYCGAEDAPEGFQGGFKPNPKLFQGGGAGFDLEPERVSGLV